VLRIQRARAAGEQIRQSDHSNQLPIRAAFDDRKPRQACRRHAVDDGAQRLVGVRHDRHRLRKVRNAHRSRRVLDGMFEMVARDNAKEPLFVIDNGVEPLAAAGTR
jgi:hypothetical protein